MTCGMAMVTHASRSVSGVPAFQRADCVPTCAVNTASAPLELELRVGFAPGLLARLEIAGDLERLGPLQAKAGLAMSSAAKAIKWERRMRILGDGRFGADRVCRRKRRRMALKTRFSAATQQHRACNINLLRRTPRVCGRIAYSGVEGADLSRFPLRSRIRVRVREGGLLALTSLSQNWLTTGTYWPVGCVAGMDRAAPGSIRRSGLSASAEPCPRPP